MDTSDNKTSRRSVLGALAALPAAAIAAPTAAQTDETPADSTAEEAANQAGYEEGVDATLTDMASAWINRWRALGGSFGWSYNNDGTPRSLGRSIPMSYTWDQPTCEEAKAQSPTLAPHELILEREDFDGAHKMLESFLTLVPGLRDQVSKIVHLIVEPQDVATVQASIAAYRSAREG